MSGAVNYLAGLGYASVFGFSFLVTKGALDALDPFELLFLRFGLAALIMSLLAALGLVRLDLARKLGRGGAARERGGRGIRDLALACIFQPILYFATETLGLAESASSAAGIVLGALPAAVAVLGIFMLKERLAARQALALGLSVAGVAVVILLGGGAGAEGAAGTPRGYLLLVGALLSATFFNIFSRKSSRVFGPVETTFAMMWTGALFFGAVAVARGLAAGTLLGPEGLAARALPAWPAILYLGALSSVLAFFLVNFTLSRLKASQSVVFANLTTVISVAAGVLLRGEPFGVAQAAGVVMIVLGVWGTNAPARGGKAAGA